MTSASSPPPSPLFNRAHPDSAAHMALGVSNIANIFVKMRRHRVKSKPHHIESSSGDAPQTHLAFQADNAVSARKVPLVEDRTFVCQGGVDTAKLLRAVRDLLYKEATDIGANVLVDEQWTCTICGPRQRSDSSYRVHIRYAAKGARSSKPDPRRPVALGNARGVPGLMTIVSRFD